MRKTTTAFRQAASNNPSEGTDVTRPSRPAAGSAARAARGACRAVAREDSGEYELRPELLALRVPWSQRDEATRERGRRDLQRRLRGYFDARGVRVVATDNRHTMLSIKRSKTTWTLRLHHMFIGAPPAIVRAVARYAQSQCPDASQALRRFIDANDDRVRTQANRRPIPIDVAGKHFHLREIYDELNAQYFDGEVDVQITWGQRGRRRRARESIRLGSYTVEDRIIRIHPVLDADDVPAMFIRFIVFHEMLHSIHEMPVVDGRRVYHTDAFRAHERTFEHFQAALIWERNNLHKLLER